MICIFVIVVGVVVWRLWFCGIMRRSHGSLGLDIAETPSQAFVRKMRSEVWLGLAAKLFEW